MSLNKTALSIIVLSLFLTGCVDTPVQVDNVQPGLHINVSDLNGASLPGVGFHYVFEVGQNIVSRNMLIRYTLPTTDTVTLKVFHPHGQEVATLLNKAYQLSGNYSYNYNADTLTNGVYAYRLTTTTSSFERKLFVLTDDIAQLQTTSPLLTTDQNGQAQISSSELGIGAHFNYQAGPTAYQLTVGDSITALFVKQGYKSVIHKIRIDTTKALTFTFQMANN